MATWPGVRLECMRELGYALVYMSYVHPDVGWGAQHGRVRALCKELARNQYRDDPAYWDSLKRRIADEIENMC